MLCFEITKSIFNRARSEVRVKRSDKKKIQYSLVSFVLITALTFFIAHMLESSTSAALAHEVQEVLDAYSEDTYTVSEPLKITNTLSSMGTFYSVKPKHTVSAEACIIRIMGIQGPVTAVFLHENSNVDFAGIAGFISTAHTNRRGITDNQISYWENKISQVFSQYFSQEETDE